MTTTRQYELVYVLSPEASEQAAAELQAQIEAIVERFGGRLEKTDNWGRRKLAYRIGPHREGAYVLHLIAGTGELMKELERRLRVNEQVLRHLVVRVDEELRAAERARARRKASARPVVSRPAAAEEEEAAEAEPARDEVDEEPEEEA